MILRKGGGGRNKKSVTSKGALGHSKIWRECPCIRGRVVRREINIAAFLITGHS